VNLDIQNGNYLNVILIKGDKTENVKKEWRCQKNKNKRFLHNNTIRQKALFF